MNAQQPQQGQASQQQKSVGQKPVKQQVAGQYRLVNDAPQRKSGLKSKSNINSKAEPAQNSAHAKQNKTQRLKQNPIVVGQDSAQHSEQGSSVSNQGASEPVQARQQVKSGASQDSGQVDKQTDKQDQVQKQDQIQGQGQDRDYVNSYQPPQGASGQQRQSPQTVQTPNQASSAQIKQKQSAQALSKTAKQASDQTNQAAQAGTNRAKQSEQSEKLEDQNIFDLLGVSDGGTDEKDQFLDELQQVIWEDFLENDLDLLVTKEEKQQVDEVLQNSNLSDLAKQEKSLSYLDSLIPDLEEIMLEKALELKEEMVQERVLGMKAYYHGDEAKLAEIEQAAKLFSQGKWHSGAQLLNQLES